MCSSDLVFFMFFFFNDTATTEIYTLSLHDALPISFMACCKGARKRLIKSAQRDSKCDRVSFFSICFGPSAVAVINGRLISTVGRPDNSRSEEHTSELQSPVPISYAVFCLKKKKKKKTINNKKKNKTREKHKIQQNNTYA